MRTIPSPLLTHLQGEVTTLAVCWRITRRDGALILGTEHDHDVTVATGAYGGTYLARAGITGSDISSSSELNVDNLEVTGALAHPDDLTVMDLSVADLEAGLLDDAAVTLFLVNWEAPDDGQIVLRSGTLGNISRTAEGQYRTELRGLTQALSRPITRVYAAACDADLFDVRCGLAAAAWTFDGVVSGVTDRRTFTVDFSSPAPVDVAALLRGGKITFTSGANDGYSMEVRAVTDGSPSDTVLLFQPMPLDIEVGDTFEVTAGCNKLRATCRDTFDNLVNFRGHGVFTPGMTEVLKVGGQE